MTEDHRDLAAGEALGALTPADKERFDELAAKDSRIASELDTHRATVAALDTGLARTPPPADLFHRILGEIEPSDLPAEPPVPVAAPTRSRRQWWPRVAVGGLAIAATAAITIALLTDGSRGAPDARAVVQGTTQFADVSGEARLYSPGDPGGTLVLELDSLPPPPSGHHYEVWVLREQAAAMEAVGSFTPARTRARLELQLPGPGAFSAVDVSVEPDGGSAEHSGLSLAGGTFSS